jgi:hypothetical protein
MCSQNCFLLDISAMHPIPRTPSSSCNTHKQLSNKSHSSIKDLVIKPTAHGMEAIAMSHNIMSVTPTLATTQEPLMLNQRPSHRMGHFVNNEGVYTLPAF